MKILMFILCVILLFFTIADKYTINKFVNYIVRIMSFIFQNIKHKLIELYQLKINWFYKNLKVVYIYSKSCEVLTIEDYYKYIKYIKKSISFQYSFIFIFIVFLYCIGNYPFLPQTNFLVFFILFSCILAKQIIILLGVLIIMGAIYIVIVSVVFNAFFETVNKGIKKDKLLARLIDKFNLMPDSKTSQNLTMCLLIAFCIYILLNYVYLLDVIKNPLNNISCLFVSFLIFHRVIVVRLESRDKEVSISNLLIFIVFPIYFILTSNVLNRMVVDELELRNLLVYRPVMTTGLPTESTIGQLKPIYKFQFGSEFMLLFPNESLVYFCTGEGERNCTLSHHKFKKDFW